MRSFKFSLLPEDLPALVSVAWNRGWEVRLIGEILIPDLEEWGFLVEIKVNGRVRLEDIGSALDWGEQECPNPVLQRLLLRELFEGYLKGSFQGEFSRR